MNPYIQLAIALAPEVETLIASISALIQKRAVPPDQLVAFVQATATDIHTINAQTQAAIDADKAAHGGQ